MKRVLVVGDFISGSGLTQVIFNVFSRFPKNQFEISAVGYGLDPSELTDKKCEEFGWKFNRVVPVTKNPIKHWKWWKEFFKQESYDIVYFNYSSSWNYLPLVYAKRYGHVQEIISHSHNSYFSHTFSNKVLMSALTMMNNHGKQVFNKYSNKKVATSREAATWMFGNDRDVFISINGIDLKKFAYSTQNRESIRGKLEVKPEEKLVGFVGVLQDRKNPLFALEVFAKYHQQNSQSKFIMLGKGPLKETIDEKIRELNIEDSVIRHDFVDDVNRWYSAMDALIFPSMYEGLSLVAIESQISNLQILASDTNVEDIFATDNIHKLGNLNVTEWSSKLNRILANSKNRDYFDQKLERFSVDNQADGIKKLL